MASPPPFRRRKRWFIALRPWLFTAILLLLWPTLDPALVEPPAILSSDPESVSGSFTRCGPGRGENCVTDGDTFKLGERKVRIIGIDAPETQPSNCAVEAQLGEAATAELERLLNEFPGRQLNRAIFPHPRSGRITIYQVMEFLLDHLLHHQQQLGRISKALGR